ncbi:hypothetical protein ACJJTC_001869 [Scirpophaga incertulas]
MDRNFVNCLKTVLVLFICFESVSAASGTVNSDVVMEMDTSNIMNCHKICGCDRFAAYYYNETSGECLVSFRHLMIAVITKYEMEGYKYAQGMAKKIEMEADRTFNAMLISVLIFITCCAICVVSACFYCCRINYSDYILKRDIKALAKKVDRTHTLKKPIKKKHHEPFAQSCNIVCEDAGVFVV